MRFVVIAGSAKAQSFPQEPFNLVAPSCTSVQLDLRTILSGETDHPALQGLLSREKDLGGWIVLDSLPPERLVIHGQWAPRVEGQGTRGAHITWPGVRSPSPVGKDKGLVFCFAAFL